MNPKICRKCWKRNGIAKPEAGLVSKEEECPLCLGSFLIMDRIGGMIRSELDSVPEIGSFSIGTKIPKEAENIEETIWENIDIGNARSVKAGLNTEIGKWIEKNSKYRFSPDPDVRMIYDPKRNSVEKQVTSVYIYGYYNKLKRMIRQTKRADSEDESVEGLIEETVLKEIGGMKAVLHGSGREDIDVLMLGNGRPFVLEIVGPGKRKISGRFLKALEKKINLHAKKKISVSLKRICRKDLVATIKRAMFDKEYEALVELDKPITKPEMERIPNQMILMQRTPVRVANRRADLIRKRRIKDMRTEWVDGRHFKANILSQSGTYIKEFVSGDGGRTNPSISSILGRAAFCKELNVLKIHSEWLDDFW